MSKHAHAFLTKYIENFMYSSCTLTIPCLSKGHEQSYSFVRYMNNSMSFKRICNPMTFLCMRTISCLSKGHQQSAWHSYAHERFHVFKKYLSNPSASLCTWNQFHVFQKKYKQPHVFLIHSSTNPYLWESHTFQTNASRYMDDSYIIYVSYFIMHA